MTNLGIHLVFISWAALSQWGFLASARIWEYVGPKAGSGWGWGPRIGPADNLEGMGRGCALLQFLALTGNSAAQERQRDAEQPLVQDALQGRAGSSLETSPEAALINTSTPEK